jgi:predicted dehydrogenase
VSAPDRRAEEVTVADLRIGVMSTARIAVRQVIPAMQAAARCEVAAIASRDVDRARAAADTLGIARAHGSYEALLEDEGINAVYIPLPNHLHAEWAIAAAEAGKHVLCEKPLAMSSVEAREMADACRNAGVILMEAFMYRLHPSWVAVREMMASGRIGSLAAVQSWFSFFNDDPENIRNIAAYGGGALMDIGCYCINQSRMLFGGEPVAVSAVQMHDPHSGVDILTSGLLEFEEGTAAFTCCIRCEPDQRVDIYGTEGRISVEIPFNIPAGRPTRVFVTAGGEPPTGPATETLTFASADQYTIEAEAFATAVLDGADVPVPPSDSVANLEVIEKVIAAARR